MEKGKAKNLRGISIYHDKGMTVYSNLFMKNGYVISDSDVKHYSFYAGRLWVSVLLGLTAFLMFDLHPLLAAGIALAFYLLSSFFFVFSFLDKLPLLKNYKKPQRTSLIEEKAKTQSISRLIGTMLLSFAIAVLIILNAKQSAYEGMLLYGSYAFATFMVITGIMNIMYLVKKKRMV
jgi:hypothetical protein